MVSWHRQVLRLHAVPGGQPPQSGRQTQVQVAGSAWCTGPQPSAAVSQTQPQDSPSLAKTYPGGQVAEVAHWQPQVAGWHTWYPVQRPPQSGVQTKSQTARLASHTVPGGAGAPQPAGHSQTSTLRLQARLPRQ